MSRRLWADEDRQLLLPYVTRLACADTQEVERRREVYIRARLPTAHLVIGRVNMEKGIEVLEGALAIGRQADPLTTETARARLEAVRGKTLPAGPKPNRPLLKKVKSWFTAELEPAD